MSKKEPRPPIPNNLKQQREDVLGFTKTKLARLSDVSEKTIQRIEREKLGFRRVTYTKVLIGINKARKKQGLDPVLVKDLFPTLTPKSAEQKPDKKKQPPK